MEPKDNLSLSKEEVAALLFDLSMSLREIGKFEFNLKDQDISIDVGPSLDLRKNQIGDLNLIKKWKKLDCQSNRPKRMKQMKLKKQSKSQ
jgi:hypothetical protein